LLPTAILRKTLSALFPYFLPLPIRHYWVRGGLEKLFHLGPKPLSPSLIPGQQAMLDLWWTQRHWVRAFSEYVGFRVSFIPPKLHTQTSLSLTQYHLRY
jgi:hypothetical protein